MSSFPEIPDPFSYCFSCYPDAIDDGSLPNPTGTCLHSDSTAFFADLNTVVNRLVSSHSYTENSPLLRMLKSSHQTPRPPSSYNLLGYLCTSGWHDDFPKVPTGPPVSDQSLWNEHARNDRLGKYAELSVLCRLTAKDVAASSMHFETVVDLFTLVHGVCISEGGFEDKARKTPTVLQWLPYYPEAYCGKFSTKPGLYHSVPVPIRMCNNTVEDFDAFVRTKEREKFNELNRAARKLNPPEIHFPLADISSANEELGRQCLSRSRAALSDDALRFRIGDLEGLIDCFRDICVNDFSLECIICDFKSLLKRYYLELFLRTERNSSLGLAAHLFLHQDDSCCSSSFGVYPSRPPCSVLFYTAVERQVSSGAPLLKRKLPRPMSSAARAECLAAAELFEKGLVDMQDPRCFQLLSKALCGRLTPALMFDYFQQSLHSASAVEIPSSVLNLYLMISLYFLLNKV